MIGVGNVEGADAGILPRRKDQRLGDERSGPVFVQIVRSEMTALLRVVDFGGDRESRDADRIFGHADVEDPGMFPAVFLIVQHSLIRHDKKIAAGKWQRRMRAAAVGRAPVMVFDEPGAE